MLCYTESSCLDIIQDHVGVSHVSEAIQKVQTESVERYFIF